VQVRVEKLDTVANRLTVNVLVYPKDSLYDKNLGVLTTDAAVRLYPENDLGDLQYQTETIAADVFTGAGQNREKAFVRVEVAGKLDGWDATVTRVHDPDEPNPDVQDDVTITLHRSKGPLIFDVGVCLVLIALPALALWVAIPMALGRTSFVPPFITWYGAMLFAIVPLRNILPGSPPYGSWVDQAIVQWVLIGLVVAMTLFVFAWWRNRDRKRPKKT
jgi:hypothetical protein